MVVDLCDAFLGVSLAGLGDSKQPIGSYLQSTQVLCRNIVVTYIYPTDMQFNISDPGKGVWCSNVHMLDIRAQQAWMRTGDPCPVKPTWS